MPGGHLAVAAWRFAAPGSAGAARTVLASKAGTEQPTQVRLASLMPASDSDDDRFRSGRAAASPMDRCGS
jgi:hypothetical protein